MKLAGNTHPFQPFPDIMVPASSHAMEKHELTMQEACKDCNPQSRTATPNQGLQPPIRDCNPQSGTATPNLGLWVLENILGVLIRTQMSELTLVSEDFGSLGELQRVQRLLHLRCGFQRGCRMIKSGLHFLSTQCRLCLHHWLAPQILCCQPRNLWCTWYSLCSYGQECSQCSIPKSMPSQNMHLLVILQLQSLQHLSYQLELQNAH